MFVPVSSWLWLQADWRQCCESVCLGGEPRQEGAAAWGPGAGDHRAECRADDLLEALKVVEQANETLQMTVVQNRASKSLK